MSGRPSCLPPREEILGFVGGALAAPEKWVVEEQADNLDALIVGAVEQALAEERARHTREVEPMLDALRNIAIAPCLLEMLGETIEPDDVCGCPGCRARAALAALEEKP